MAKTVASDLDEEGHPTREGVYEARFEDGPWEEIDVYYYSPKGLCCFQYDLIPGSGTIMGQGDDDHACHISVQFTGLIFGKRVRGLDESTAA